MELMSRWAPLAVHVHLFVAGDMGLLPHTENCGLRMRRECRERFPRLRGLAIPTRITARDARAVVHVGSAN